MRSDRVGREITALPVVRVRNLKTKREVTKVTTGVGR